MESPPNLSSAGRPSLPRTTTDVAPAEFGSRERPGVIASGWVDVNITADDGNVPEGRMWLPHPCHRYRGHRLIVKRWIDVVLGSALLVTTSPVMVVVLAAVRLTSPGPALFRQHRVGHGGTLFRIIKFRTMHVDAEDRLIVDEELRAKYLQHGFKLPLHEDPRVTPIGTFLRRTSLDELPQLWNVVKGEMSLVGPRPVLADELPEYRGYLAAYKMAKPGLTGPWQVAGRDAVRFPHRARFDADYIDRWSLTRDLVILAKTIPSALRARGVS